MFGEGRLRLVGFCLGCPHMGPNGPRITVGFSCVALLTEGS